MTQTEIGEGVVGGGAGDFEGTQVVAVTLDFHAFAGFGKNGIFAEVGEDDIEGALVGDGLLPFEGIFYDVDGVDIAELSVGTIDTEFGLTQISKGAREVEGVFLGAGGKTKKKGYDTQGAQP